MVQSAIVREEPFFLSVSRGRSAEEIDMPSAKELREKRAALVPDMKRLRDLYNQEGREWTEEDEGNWKKVNADYDAMSRQIDLEERVEKAEADQAAPAGDRRIGREDRNLNGAVEIEEDTEGLEDEIEEEDEEFRGRKNKIITPDRDIFRLALQAWCRYGKFELEKRHVQACKRAGVNPALNYVDLGFRTGDYGKIRREYRAQSTAATEGGETIPEGFVNNLEISLLAFGGMREVSEVIRTATGNALPWPTTNDIANEGALLAENAAVSEQDIVTGAMILNAFKYSSKMVKVSAELLQDSAFDLASVLGALLGERIGRITNKHFTTGTGSGQPNGIVTASSAGHTLPNGTGNVSTFTAPQGADGIISLIHSVDPAYRNAPGVGFLMNDTTLSHLRRLKDTTNQYIFQESLRVGEPARLLGYPITINQSMASPAASAKTIIFGQLTKYKIRDVAGFRLRRLVERFADADQEAFLAFSRHDGDLLDAGTDPIKHLAMAAS
jgi:HK97 family phage major capsid protein